MVHGFHRELLGIYLWIPLLFPVAKMKMVHLQMIYIDLPMKNGDFPQLRQITTLDLKAEAATLSRRSLLSATEQRAIQHLQAG